MREISIRRIQPVFEDSRGKIFDILDDEIILHVGIITSTKGAVRGNHYHKKAKQYNHILQGKIELSIKDIDNETNRGKKKYILEKGDFVSIPSGIIHSLKALEDSVFLDLNTESRSEDGYEQDTIRVSNDSGV